MTGSVKRPIGFVDWGIGGLGVLGALRARGVTNPVVYVSDTGWPPYGTLPRSALARRIARVGERLVADHDILVLVVACNAASTVIPDITLPIPLVGTIESAASVVRRARAMNVGVVGGRRTIRSGVLRRALERHGARVTSRVAQPLSGLIERAAHREPSFEATLRSIVAPLRHVDALLLACTHYPAATEAFARALPRVTLLDPAEDMALRIERALPGEVTRARRTAIVRAADRVYTTGGARAMRKAARAAWGVELGIVDRVSF